MVRKGDTKVKKCASGDAGDGRLKRRGFSPGVGKIPWRRQWQPTPVFLPGESHGQRSQAGYSPRGGEESDTTKVTKHMLLHLNSSHRWKYYWHLLAMWP